MKVLLDEQIDVRMKGHLPDFKVFTLHDYGWLGLKNGELREAMHGEDFQFLVTADKNMPFQQNLEKLRFTLLLLDTPFLLWTFQEMFVPKLRDFLQGYPEPLPRIVHFSVDGLSNGGKKNALLQMVGPEQILFL